MLKIAVCDDEEYYKNRVEELLSDYFEKRYIVYTMDTYNSGIQLLELGETVKEYDMIFLDINMKEIDGLETAKHIRMYSRDVLLIFVTAFVTYSLEGYKVNAIRYILKDNDSIKSAFTECLDTIVAMMGQVKRKQTFEFQGGKKQVILDNIIYVESNLHKLIFYITKGENIMKYCMYKKLDTIEEQLQHDGFCRIHKSYLVNLQYVYDLQRYQVELTNGEQLNVAKPRYKEVVNQYVLFKGDI